MSDLEQQAQELIDSEDRLRGKPTTPKFPLFSEAPHRWTVEQLEALAAKEEKVAGMKFDAGKPMAGLMVSDFANALLAVSEVSTFGAKKYAPHSWATVPNARERYNDALYRHLFLAAAGEAQDQESKLLHAAHVAWNALALLELEICDEGRTGR